MLRLVLDTNVVLDLFHWANLDALPLSEALTAGSICCLADDDTLAEFSRVLTYPRLKLTPAMIEARWACYTRLVTRLPPAAGPAPALPRCRDRDDQKFLELAARAGADLLVSRDKALLKLRGRASLPFAILPPAAACHRLPTVAGP